MVTVEDRELFLKTVNNLAWIADKSEPSTQKIKRPPRDFDVKLDLHGLNSEQALGRVKACLMRCLELHQKRVLIIHGKGSCILRYEIRNFLGSSQWVAEVRDAPARLGGDGAVLVLLRAATPRHI